MQRSSEKKKDIFMNSLDAALGNISLACKMSCISPSTYYSWTRSDEEFKKRVSQVMEDISDFGDALAISPHRGIND